MLLYVGILVHADVAELADALDLGSSGRPCRFDSCHPHQKRQEVLTGSGFPAFYVIIEGKLFKDGI